MAYIKKPKKEIGLKITFSEEKCTKEESLNAMADLCYMVFKGDRDYHRNKLLEGPQYCDYCGKQITELYDFCSPDDRNCCYECGKKLLKDPNRPKTFCGFPVIESDRTKKT